MPTPTYYLLTAVRDGATVGSDSLVTSKRGEVRERARALAGLTGGDVTVYPQGGTVPAYTVRARRAT